MPESSMRRWWAAITLSSAAMVVYVSLVPFTFVAPHGDLSLEGSVRALFDTRIFAPGNFLANILLFVPIGFFGTAFIVDGRRGAAPWAVAAATVVPSAVGLSVGVEILQRFVQGRTPSALDVAAQLIGTVVGFVAWAGTGRRVRSLLVDLLRGDRRALEIALFGYVLFQGLRLLEPFDIIKSPVDIARKLRGGQWILNPFHSPSLAWSSLPSMLADFMFAVPVGVAMAIVGGRSNRPRPASSAIALSMLFFVAGESAQLFLRSRSPDALDLLTNCLGAFVGVLLAGAIARTAAVSETRGLNPRILWTVCLGMWAIVYLAYNWSPFDFTLSPRPGVSSRLGMLLGVPFKGYYQNAEFKALAEAFVKLGLGIPLGLFFSLGARPDLGAIPRGMAVAWLSVSCVFFAVVEVGQVFLPSRYADNSDVLLALAGVAIGLLLPRPFRSRLASPSPHSELRPF